MKHVYSIEEANLETPSLVTIGVFDGVHKGHQALIKKLVDKAHAQGQLAVVLTFFPHPDIVLRGLQGRYYLMSPEMRAKELTRLGVDCVVTHAFNEDVRQMRAADFVDRLVKYLKLESLWVGADFALGYQREGNVDFLTEKGKEKGFSVEVVELITDDSGETAIKSSNARELLLEGKVGDVRDLLGRSYELIGEIVHGEKRGRTIGFPTANVDVWSEQIIPANGVYAGWATLGDESFMAVTNIGIRPTFEGQNVTVEAHLLDFDRDIYGQTMQLTFETRLRSEMKFNGIQELIAQIGADAQAARDYLMAHPQD